jgi:hypothetical protein
LAYFYAITRTVLDADLVWRALHGKRDIPAWMHEAAEPFDL